MSQILKKKKGLLLALLKEVTKDEFYSCKKVNPANNHMYLEQDLGCQMTLQPWATVIAALWDPERTN